MENSRYGKFKIWKIQHNLNLRYKIWKIQHNLHLKYKKTYKRHQESAVISNGSG